MTSIREAQKQMTRRLLLEMALELFEQKGYAATTVDDIAVAVGTTRATFYAHFPSKGQLMLVLVARSNRILSEADVPPLGSVVASGDRFRSGSGSRANLISGPTSGRTWRRPTRPPPVSRKSKRPWKGGSTTPSTTCRQGLDLANRFEESSRRVRCALAFGELEFFSRRWMRLGWAVDRETSLELMVDNWCFLLAE